MDDGAAVHPLVKSLHERARALRKRIALPEYTDVGTLQAAATARDMGIAQIVIVGDPEQVAASFRELSLSPEGIEVMDPCETSLRRRHADTYYTLRRARGASEEDAWELVADPLYAAALLLRDGVVDGSVAGALNSTPNVLRPLLQVVRCAPGVSVASSCFIMVTPMAHMGENGAFVYADAGVIPNPTAEQLADIAITSAQSCQLYLQAEPRVAMLSFSTKGTSDHPDALKVREATRIAQLRAPQLLLDGEIQADTAIDPGVAARKDPSGILGGRANVLIFPDLDAGNIGYKLTQRLSGGKAFGPLLQGLARAGMDLSRGANVDEIVTVIAAAAVRADGLAAARARANGGRVAGGRP